MSVRRDGIEWTATPERPIVNLPGAAAWVEGNILTLRLGTKDQPIVTLHTPVTLVTPPVLDYEARVGQMAMALHEDCLLEWNAIAAVDPGRLLTLHMVDAHYGKAHDLVRRVWPELTK